jgi:hypothetical protein
MVLTGANAHRGVCQAGWTAAFSVESCTRRKLSALTQVMYISAHSQDHSCLGLLHTCHIFQLSSKNCTVTYSRFVSLYQLHSVPISPHADAGLSTKWPYSATFAKPWFHSHNAGLRASAPFSFQFTHNRLLTFQCQSGYIPLATCHHWHHKFQLITFSLSTCILCPCIMKIKNYD